MTGSTNFNINSRFFKKRTELLVTVISVTVLTKNMCCLQVIYFKEMAQFMMTEIELAVSSCCDCLSTG
jgi:hypothetical protein